jgi:parallel beta-helix repeat protein
MSGQAVSNTDVKPTWKQVKYLQLRLIELVSVILFFLSSSICFASTFYIDPSAASNGTGTQAAPYNTWAGLIFQPGSTYLQNAGTTYNAQLSIVHNNTGSSGAPIVLGSYGTGAMPIIHNLYVEDISWFTFNNLSFPFGVNAIPVAHVTFTNNDFSNPSFNTGFGFYLSGSGTFITVSNNTFHDTLNDCVTLHTTNNASGNGTQFLNNTVYNCGMYGITIWTSWATVSGNIVHTTGLIPQAAGGGSAVHNYNGCFGSDPCGTEGHNNLITRNMVFDAHDPKGDGNGIQSDQMTQNNTITQNLSFANDGEGLSLYDSANNVVSQNVFFNNGLDRTLSHTLRGNITVDASTRFFGTYGNSIVNNTVIVSDIGATAGMLGTGPFGFEVSQPAGINSYGGNKLLKANSDPSMHIYSWWNAPPYAPTQGDNAAFWNGNSNPNRVHTASDVFGSVTITSTVGAPAMDFILPTAYQIPVLNNGATIKLYGWRADNGLYGTYPTAPPGPLPDLIVTSLSYDPASGLFTSVVKNQGTAATPAGVTVGVSYSVDGVSQTWGTVMGPLAAGASVTINCGGGAYAIPSGTHTITAFADDLNRIAESKETNNTLSQSITIAGSNLPDLIVTSLSYNTATGLFTSVVTNQNPTATPAGVVVGVSYSVDGVSRTWGTVMGPLAAGASVTIGCGGGAYAIPSGTHTITAFADDLNRIVEANESNNMLSKTITIP